MTISDTESDSIRILALIEAFAEIMNVAAPKKALILAQARKEMGGP